MNDETQLKEAIDYVEDDSFTFEGYQVVRGEFFSHVFEPSFTFNNYKRKKAPEIKQMPKYDPDAELSSLTLTIPSWISSIERTRNTADFEYVSKDAIYKMNLQLQILQEAIHILMEATKENSNE